MKTPQYDGQEPHQGAAEARDNVVPFGDSEALPVRRPISRRDFLQKLGIGAVGAAAASILVPKSLASALASELSDLERARAIALASPLYQGVIDELGQRGFAFSLLYNPISYSPDPNTVGISPLRNIPPDYSAAPQEAYQASATIFVTVHLDLQAVGAVNFIECHIVPTTVPGYSTLEIRRVEVTTVGRTVKEDKHALPYYDILSPSEPAKPTSGSTSCEYRRWYPCGPMSKPECRNYVWCRCYDTGQERWRQKCNYVVAERTCYVCEVEPDCNQVCTYDQRQYETMQYQCSDYSGCVNS
jgi:hypothetical protein